jgi:(p)ppGpp synthase/HD superfamily hydrolase
MDFKMLDLYSGAMRYAASRHDGQLYGDSPYIVHVGAVAYVVSLVAPGYSDFDLGYASQVAVLHDVLEDTDTSYSELANIFGVAVADGVQALTKDKALAHDCRMRDSLRRIKEHRREVWVVKLSDRFCNLQTLPVNWNQLKREQYLQEAKVILEELRSVGGPAIALLEERISQNPHLL